MCASILYSSARKLACSLSISTHEHLWLADAQHGVAGMGNSGCGRLFIHGVPLKIECLNT